MPKITIRVAHPGKQELQVLSELSSGSLFIRANKFLPLGTEVQVEVHLPGAPEPLHLRGAVERVVDDDAARARKASGMSLAMALSGEPVRSQLAALLAAHHLPAPATDVEHTEPLGIPLPAPELFMPALPPVIALPAVAVSEAPKMVAPVLPPAVALPPPMAPVAPVAPVAVAEVPAEVLPPPAPVEKAPAPVPAPARDGLERRVRELEASLSLARNAAQQAAAQREEDSSKHQDAVKALHAELAALRAQSAPPSPQGSRLLPALFGLVAGAAVASLAWSFIPPVVMPVAPVAPVAVALQAEAEPHAEAPIEAREVEVEPAIPVAGAATPEVTEPEPAEVKEPEEQPAEHKVAEGQPAEVVTADPEPTDTVPPDEPPAEVKTADAQPAETKPDVQPARARPSPPVLSASAGTLSLRADYPATVYVNGRRAGKTPIAAFKVNPGKVQLRFDCVVEDTLMRGKNRSVELPPNGEVRVDHECVQ